MYIPPPPPQQPTASAPAPTIKQVHLGDPHLNQEAAALVPKHEEIVLTVITKLQQCREPVEGVAHLYRRVQTPECEVINGAARGVRVSDLQK